MASFSSLIEILNAIENRLDSVLSDSKDTIKFNESIKSLNELENLLKILNDFIIIIIREYYVVIFLYNFFCILKCPVH